MDSVISTEELDVLLKQILEARATYEKAKEESTRLYHIKEELESRMIELLSKAGKTNWKIDGLGTATVVETMAVPVPKTIEDKMAVFNYIMQKYGKDVAFDKFSVHSKTLQSFYKQELEAAEDPSLFILPGVEQPTSQKEFRFRKA